MIKTSLTLIIGLVAGIVFYSPSSVSAVPKEKSTIYLYSETGKLIRTFQKEYVGSLCYDDDCQFVNFRTADKEVTTNLPFLEVIDIEPVK